MPVKRYEVDGNPYDVSDAKEQEFLSKFSNAVFIGVLDEDTNEVITQETQDFPTSTVEDADAVQQPMTASQAGVTELPSEDISSESQDPKPRYLEFKSGIVVYEDTYLETKAGKPGYPPTFDEYAAAFGSTPKEFSVEETTIKATPSADKLIELKEVANSRVYNKKTKKFESTGINQELFSFEEEGGVKIYNKLFEGSNIDFVETDAQKEGFKGGGPGLMYGAGETVDLTDLGLEAIKARILNPETGEYVYSEDLEFESDGSIANSDKLESFIEANKGTINVPGWTRSKNKLVGQYKNWLNTEYNPMLKKAEFSASEQYLTNDDLFKPVTKTKTAAGYNVGYTYEETVQPYQSELAKEVNKLKAKNPNASAQEIEDRAKLNVRTNLYEASRNDAIWNIRQKFIENSSNKDEAQAFLYASETFVKDKEAKAYNESSEKSQIAADEIEKNIADGNFVAKVYSQGLSDDTENDKINEIAKKYKVQVVPSANTISNTEFNSKFNLPKDAKVSENLYNLINAIDISREANANDYKKQVKKSNDAIANISDLSTSMDATAKNYELVEKWAANIGLGFSDIGMGIGYLGGSILTLGQSDKLKELGSEYVESTNNIRNSYVRDVSIDNAFSSAENTGKFVAQEVSNQIPILAAMMMSGGAASFVVGASSMGGKMMDMENEIVTGKADYSGAEVWLKSAGYGLAEGVFSQLTTVQSLNRAKLNWMGAGKEQIIDSSTKAYLKSQSSSLIYEPLSEAVGEIATTGAQNLIDGKPVMQDMKHAGVSGLGFGFAFAAIPFMKGMYNSQFSTYKSREEIRNLQKEIKDLGVDLDKSLLTKTKREIERNIKSKTEELNNKIQEQDYIIKNNFTSGGIESVSKLINIQADLENQAKEIQADDTIDSETRAELISDLQNKYNNIIQAKQKALSLRSITGNQTEWEAFKGLDRSKSKEYLDTAESILAGENGGRKVGKEAINAKAYDLYFGDIVREENKKLGRKNSSLFKNFKSFETVEDAINDLDAQPDLDPKERQRIIKGLKNGNDGYADPNTKAQVAVVENQVANQRRYTKTHEVGHQAFWSLLGNKQNSVAFKGISNQLLETLKSTDEKVYNQLLEDGIRDDDGNIDPTEVISRFLEYVNEDKITNVQKAKGIAGLFGVMVQKEFNKDYNFDFRGEQDIFNFVVGMAKKIKDGTLTTADIKKAKESKVIKDLPTSDISSKKATTAFSKETSAKASQEVQRIYDEQGVAGAFDILEKFKPITNKIVERRRDAPNFDRQLLTDEIETGKRGIFDLIKEYKPESGVPLAAYINKFLPARAIEASKRVLGEEFTDDVTEAKGVAAEEVVVDAKDKPVKKISPKKLKTYTGVVASNLGVSSSEVANTIDKAIEADLKDKPIKTFGESRNIGTNLAKTLGKAFGLNPEVFTKKTRNIQKKELDGLRNLRQFLDNNAAKDFSLLPDAYAGPSTIEGKSTFIPNNILNALYRKNDKGKWEKDPTKTVQDYKDLLGKIDGSVYRAAEAQTIKGLAAMSFRNLIVEKAAETAEPKARVDIKAGAKFSEAAQSLGRAARRKPGGLSKENNLKPIKRGTVKYIGSNGQEKSETRWQLTDQEKIELPLFINSIAKLFNKSFFTTGNFAFGQRSLVGKAGDLKKALEGAEYNNNAPVMPKRFEYKKLSPSQIKAKVKDKNFIDNQKELLPYLKFIFTQIETDLKQNPQHLKYWEAVINDAQNSQSHFMRFLAPFKFYNLVEGKIVEEHSMPQNNVANFLLESALNGTVNKDFPFIEDNYFQGALLETDDKKTRGVGFNYVSQMPEVFFEVENPTTWLRYLNENVSNTDGGINPNQYALLNGQTLSEFFNASVDKGLQNLDMISFQQEEILKKLKDNKYNPQKYIQEYGKLVRNKAKASKINNNNTPSNTKFSKNVTNQKALDNLGNIDKALSIARNADAPVKKIRVFDFDDTLATTKSNVLYTMPNNEGGFSKGSTKLKAIFMVGGPGAGKTNVGKGLQLGRRGYKVVNQDIALEAMKTESGLPANESNYTAEQRSIRSKLGSAARKAAVAKFDKYAANGDGMVIDGTGASYNATTKKIKALQEKGYEVHMVVANTPLETALERNRARKERSLEDFIVEKTYNQVQESLAKYREDFGDRLYEINTEAIEYGKPLPGDFLQGVYKGINANKVGKVDAATFAKEAGNMEAQGAQWDFSEFSKVMQGSKGPLLDVAKIIADKRGTKDVFVLTARPANAAGPIKEFLESMGLSIPLENITGLGDGTPQAKARWIVDKAANGYNDFYFADDHTGNVKAVKDALSVLDVKSKVQQAYVKFSKPSKLNKDFNDIIEGATGIASEKVYGKAKAQVAGASRGKVFRGIAYSAQDFVGLLYETLGKGKEGDAQMAWYKKNLLDPYARAMNDLSSARLAMMNDYRALKKQLGIVPKNLRKKLPGEPWTREQAVRVYVWSKQGTEVPGISKADLKDLNSFVANNAELQVFANQLIAIQKGDMYPEPGEGWVAGSISTDMLKGLSTIKRVKYLEQWQANVDAIFSKENKNKLEAAYGIKYVKALENSLERMKTGRNRSFSDDSLTGRFTDWLQGSVGAIMFFNTRSAVLQTLSAVNFVNFTDNNPYAAAKAFGNQKQYWKDFATLMNSDFLKERRSGLRINVSEADIADMAKQEGPRGVINKLLQLGFAPTQIADSFAIASGGATFYRNRAKTYMKEGMDQAQAEEKAFQDFRENAEESQQSSRPDKISAQQAGPLGRLILAFANTPAQYARLTDKAIRDLKNGRGDAKTNISKIIYYTTVQNIIFNAVQQALFAMAFGDEEPEDEKKQEKYVSIANGMADSLLRGTGIAGSVISVGKNAIIRIIKESKKKRPKYEKVVYELLKISPPISAKISRINQAARAYEWNKEEMMTKGFSLDNPAFLAGGNVVSALTNIPLDRVVKKVNNVVKATESDLELWERVALFAGWQDWELGIKKEEKPKKRKLIKRKQTFKTRKFKTRKFN